MIKKIVQTHQTATVDCYINFKLAHNVFEFWSSISEIVWVLFKSVELHKYMGHRNKWYLLNLMMEKNVLLFHYYMNFHLIEADWCMHWNITSELFGEFVQKLDRICFQQISMFVAKTYVSSPNIPIGFSINENLYKLVQNFRKNHFPI